VKKTKFSEKTKPKEKTGANGFAQTGIRAVQRSKPLRSASAKSSYHARSLREKERMLTHADSISMAWSIAAAMDAHWTMEFVNELPESDWLSCRRVAAQHKIRTNRSSIRKTACACVMKFNAALGRAAPFFRQIPYPVS